MPELGLDLHAASRVASSETYGDWYRDPWGWPELSPEFVSTLSVNDLGLNQTGRRGLIDRPAFHVFSFPKSFVGVRPAVIMDPRARLLFTSAALSVSTVLQRDLPDWVFGWRQRDGVLSTNEWDLYRESQAVIGHSPHAAQSDITSFFSSINTERLIDILRETCGSIAPVDIVEDVLTAHSLLSSRSGLPQRSMASSLLAHVAMREVDDLLASEISAGRLTSARRWMDDITFEGGEPELYGAFVLLQEHGRKVGLEINTSKTKVTTGAESAAILEREAQRLIRVPRFDGALRDEYGDLFTTFVTESELDAAEDSILSEPTKAVRTEVGLVVKSLTHYAQYDRVAEWMRQAKYLPHAADHVSRYIAKAGRESILFPDPAQWFVGMQLNGWPHLEWVSAQHALSVSSDQIDGDTSRILHHWLEYSTSLQQVAVAVQRLAISGTPSVRTAITNRIDRTNDPLITRLLALGLLMAAGSRRQVTNALARHPSNTLILKQLSDVGWRLPTSALDFDPAASPNRAAEGQ